MEGAKISLIVSTLPLRWGEEKTLVMLDTLISIAESKGWANEVRPFFLALKCVISFVDCSSMFANDWYILVLLSSC